MKCAILSGCVHTCKTYILNNISNQVLNVSISMDNLVNEYTQKNISLADLLISIQLNIYVIIVIVPPISCKFFFFVNGIPYLLEELLSCCRHVFTLVKLLVNNTNIL